MAFYKSKFRGEEIDKKLDCAEELYLDITVKAASFIGSSEADYPYKANVSLKNITAEHFVMIGFAETEKYSDMYAPFCDSYDGGVSIYAKEIPSSDIIIASVRAKKAVE